MSAGARVAAFAALLVAIFGVAALAGGAIDPGPDAQTAGGGHGADGHEGGSDTTATGTSAHGATGSVATPDGLASSDVAYRLVATTTRFETGRAAPLRFRILDARGATVRAFETEQARRMHVIVVRRDLRRYQHLHPSQAPDGAWTAALTLPDAGVYRAFADFRSGGAQHVLGVDLFAPGDFAPLALPPRAGTASVDGYDVRLRAGDGDELRFAVSRDGRAVSDLQPYLGARGHLVSLRAGDLAYRHSHPVDAATSNEIAFAGAAGATPGTHRLFLQFRHGGRVHTAAFTR